MALYSDTFLLQVNLICADPFAEAGDNDDSGRDYVHIRVISRFGFAFPAALPLLTHLSIDFQLGTIRHS